MRDANGNRLHDGDIVQQIITDRLHAKGAEWVILGIGIEPSTNRKIAVMKSEKDYIMCAYQQELKFFVKKEVAVC